MWYQDKLSLVYPGIIISNIDSRYFYEIVIEFFMDITNKITSITMIQEKNNTT
ncbi:hypothetical protein CNEO4_440039 [Clostridium neonatale]|uniref:Uncharacterized protein n=1 Tax=Clostridium neonatale TaxID=137838 RepID=A0AA86JQ45_9CLOT|nr:hypothetical protein CNEO_44420 [Clostridium neonatale]CAG9712511.1 hypothetical protein CNEO_470036 [Clostridium neonatale]CAI3197294.1 hypothetical protein CNEO2_220033 [Clostridium neonatale]CAI3203069.1 hypothetical protein CNEO2_270033 [Clostridium neonatale]CAI3203510.1 hypothetical protein CNEO2_330069 [Clostridium neonatale]